MSTTVRKAHDLRIELEKDIRALCMRYEQQTEAEIKGVTVHRVYYPDNGTHDFIVEVKVEV